MEAVRVTVDHFQNDHGKLTFTTRFEVSTNALKATSSTATAACSSAQSSAGANSNNSIVSFSIQK